MAAKNIKKKPRTPEQVRRQAREVVAVAAMVAIGCLAAITVFSVFAVRDHHNAQAYAAAPKCPAGVRGTGDCIAVLPETVTSVSPGGKGGDLVDLTGSLIMEFKADAPAWAVDLKRGDSVRVQVWEGQAQALVSPSGALVYDNDAAPKASLGDLPGVLRRGLSVRRRGNSGHVRRRRGDRQDLAVRPCAAVPLAACARRVHGAVRRVCSRGRDVCDRFLAYRPDCRRDGARCGQRTGQDRCLAPASQALSGVIRTLGSTGAAS